MVIPEAAVEAAAGWGDVAPMVRQIRLKKLRAALEQAWDVGHQCGYAEGADVDLVIQPAVNPYRTAK